MSRRFYVLDHIHACDIRLYAGGQRMNSGGEHCPVCNAWHRAVDPREVEIALNHVGRHRFTEHLWHHNVFRHDVIEVWRGAGLTGFLTRPVRIVGWRYKTGKPLPADIPAYSLLVTTSLVRLKQPPPEGAPCSRCGFVKYASPSLGHTGMRVAASSWDGSDFFGVGHDGFILCSQRAAAVTLAAGYNKRIAFIRVEDYGRWEDYNWRKWTPQAYREHVESFLIRRVEDL